MSIVTVQVGQCGNQLGAALFSALADEADAGPDDFAAETRQARGAPGRMRRSIGRSACVRSLRRGALR
jgi:hypothetical protein